MLEPYVRKYALGRIFVAPLDVLLDPKLVLQPDVLVVPPGEVRKRSDVLRRLLLAAEVVSPGSAKHDRVTKRPLYQVNRVSEYWIIDERSQTFERWRPDDERPAILSERLEWLPQGAAEPFVLDLPAYFAEIIPEEDGD
jgi:Uma2 family endonuclease